MSLRMTIARKGLVVISVPLIFQFIFVCVLASLLQYSQEDSAKLALSRSFVTEVDLVNRDFLELGIALAAFRYTKGSKFVKEYDRIAESLPARFDNLNKLAQGNSARAKHVEKLKEYGRNVIELTQSFRRPSDSAIIYLLDPIAYRQKISDAFSLFMDESRAIFAEELQLQDNSPASESTMRKWMKVYIAIGLLCSTLLTVILTRFFMTNITRRLGILTQNNLRFAEKEQLLAPVLGDDEITELDQNFRSMVGRVQQAENRRQLYVKMISHDLRAPLSSIRGTLEAAARGLYGQLSPKGSVRFESAQSDSDRLIGMINEMIDYDSLADGTIELAEDRFNAKDLMVAAQNSLETLAEGKHVKLQFSCDDATLEADKERLKRVLINLIHNAIKFSPAQGVVKAEARVKDNDLVFRIIDQGPGIKPDEIANLFQPFHMGASGLTASDTGSGLGLAICKMIVEAHHGTLGLDSKVGQGSCFWFTVPLH